MIIKANIYSEIEINNDERIDESTLYHSNTCLIDSEEIDNE